ncbi:MAG TPA: hypothetical protein VIL52_09100, partial [Bacteroidota bacterium]
MKSSLRRLSVYMFITVCFTLIANAQNTGSIAGTVRDAETKETIPNVNVRLKDTPLGSAADINGKY